MIEITNMQAFNFEGALRGLRNPMNSWSKSDSRFGLWNIDDPAGLINSDDMVSVAEAWISEGFDKEDVVNWLISNGIRANMNSLEYAFLGPKDTNLSQAMVSGGPEEGKFARQIFVSMDIEAPLYWWKEMDTYKVGTTANSTSTMHKLTAEPFTKRMFSFDSPSLMVAITDTTQVAFGDCVDDIITMCEILRQKYVETRDPEAWKALVQILPCAYNQKRTWTANYQVLRNIYFQRRNHKLSEWHDFCNAIMTLPYSADFITLE